ncbi:MAG TPA: PAS domain S-box protein [Stenomitos sp.]
MLRILLLEDSLLDTELIQAYLTNGGIDAELVQVETSTDFQSALNTGSFNLILSDYSLPTFNGIAALDIAQTLCPDVPFIFVSATLGEELAIETLKRGATDYVLKQRLERLVPAVKRALRETQERVERQRTQEQLRQLTAELEQRVEERTAQLAQANQSLQAEIAERKKTEERLRLLESVAVTANDAIMITEAEPIDEPGPRIIYVNEAFTRMTGYSKEEVLGKTPRILQGPKSERAQLDQFRSALKQWQPTVVELINYRKDGSEFWVEISIVPVANAEGWYTHWVAVERDISDRKRSEDALRLSDEILQQMPDAVLLTDLNLSIQKWTGKAEELFGYTAQEVIGTKVTSLMPSDITATMTEKIIRTIQETGTFCGEMICRRKDGSEVPIEATAKALYDATGHPVGFLSINRDITERKRAEKQKEQLIREQAARLEAEVQGLKSAFLAEASTVLASSLDYETTLASVAKLAVPFIADWCAVDILEKNQTIRRVAIAHLEPAKVELAWELNRRYPERLNAAMGLAAILRTGESAIATEILDSDLVAIAQDAQHLQSLRELNLKSCIGVPLVARGRTLGAITFATAESGRHYSSDELSLVEDLARRAAMAVDNAQLYRDTQEARRIAEETAKRTASLQSLTASLSEALSLAQVGEVVVNQGLAVLRANAGFIALLNARDQTLELVNPLGYPQELLKTWNRFPLTAEVPITDAVKTNKAIFLESREVFAERYPHLTTQYSDSPHHSWAAIPLSVDGHTLGGIGFSFVNAQTFNPEDCAFMQALAQQCAQAIERARAYAAERQARAESEAANRMKDEFLATLSHELRTPLNAMVGWMQLLRTRTFDPLKMAQVLETIDRNTKSLAALIEDILDVSCIMMGKLHLSVASCELIPVIEAAMETIRPAAEAKLIQIDCFLDASTQLVWGDANRLQQVVWNLLSNAVKFTPPGGRVEIRLERVEQLDGSVQEWQVDGTHPRTVTHETVSSDPLTRDHRVSPSPIACLNHGLTLEYPSPSFLESQVPAHKSLTQVSNSYAQIRVTDTGKGIAAHFLPYVFDRFRQENSSTTRSYGGLGLGLALVRYLVEQHGGTVQAFSPGENRGAIFTVQLPLLMAHPAEYTQTTEVLP